MTPPPARVQQHAQELEVAPARGLREEVGHRSRAALQTRADRIAPLSLEAAAVRVLLRAAEGHMPLPTR